MRALLKLMGREKATSQALVKAPAMDLIKSDNEFQLPDPEEIQIEIEPEKLESYTSIADTYGFAQEAVGREKLSHFLKSKGFKVYDRSRVDDFMKRYIDHAFKNLKLGNDLWWQWMGLREYRHPLPCRVAENIKTISTSNKNAVFFVSDIVLVTSRNGWENGCKNTNTHLYKWDIIPMKRKTEICFLRVATSSSMLPEESPIIDAWRGPTFSDEEAKI